MIGFGALPGRNPGILISRAIDAVGLVQILVDLLGGNLDRELDGVFVGAFNGGLHRGDQATRDPATDATVQTRR